MGIYQELGIDTNQALSNPQAFSDQVHAAASVMVEKLRTNTDAKSYLKALPKGVADLSDFDRILDAVYVVTEDYNTEDLQNLADKVRELANTIAFAARSRAAAEAALVAKDIDKPKIHADYVELRETFNKLADILKGLTGTELSKLPAMPGNYNSPVHLLTTMFIKGDVATQNYMEVSKDLSLKGFSMMDVTEYIDANPDCGWTYTKVKV